jgi:hypothetical protein
VRSPRRQSEAAPVPDRPSASSAPWPPAEPEKKAEQGEKPVIRQPVPTPALARSEVARYSLRVELPQHHERARALACVPSLPFAPSLMFVAPVLAPLHCSARSRKRVRVLMAGPPAQPQATPQATQRAKALPPEPAQLTR